MNTIRNALVIALLAAAPAYAQQGAPKPAQPAAQQGGGPDAVFAQWDTDKNGTLTKDEFRVGWSRVRNEMVLQRLYMEFEQKDTNKSGKLEAAEYSQLMLVQRMGKSAPAMTAFDADKSGGLEFPEYLELIKSATRQGPASK